MAGDEKAGVGEVFATRDERALSAGLNVTRRRRHADTRTDRVVVPPADAGAIDADGHFQLLV